MEAWARWADQVATSFETYGKYNKLTLALLIGGVAYADQERKLDRGVDVLIATPGRLLDHFERGQRIGRRRRADRDGSVRHGNAAPCA